MFTWWDRAVGIGGIEVREAREVRELVELVHRNLLEFARVSWGVTDNIVMPHSPARSCLARAGAE